MHEHRIAQAIRKTITIRYGVQMDLFDTEMKSEASPHRVRRRRKITLYDAVAGTVAIHALTRTED